MFDILDDLLIFLFGKTPNGPHDYELDRHTDCEVLMAYAKYVEYLEISCLAVEYSVITVFLALRHAFPHSM